MKKGTKIILGILLLSGIGTLVWWLTKGEKEIKKSDGTPLEDTPNPQKIIEKTEPSQTDSFPLKNGSSGDNVSYLQRALNNLGAKLKVDGSFGNNTYNAVLTKAGTKFYPVTADSFAQILKKANTEAVKKVK